MLKIHTHIHRTNTHKKTRPYILIAYLEIIETIHYGTLNGYMSLLIIYTVNKQLGTLETL